MLRKLLSPRYKRLHDKGVKLEHMALLKPPLIHHWHWNICPIVSSRHIPRLRRYLYQLSVDRRREIA